MEFSWKILFVVGGALLSDATFTCPHGTFVHPQFNIEIFHLQDASPANTRGRIKMKDIYTGFITDMINAYIPVKMGTAGFVDDDGFQASEDGRFCYRNVANMDPVEEYVDVLERLNRVPADQSNYDRYEAGFKAMTMAANGSAESVVPWSTRPHTLKILLTASNAAPKVAEGPRKCPSAKSKSWNDCERWNSERSYQSATQCLDVHNQPTYDDFARVANKDVNYINFVYYNDAERDSYFGARSRWGTVAYELANRGFKASMIDENRYFYMLGSLLRLVQSEACVSGIETSSTTTTANVEIACKGKLSEACYCPDEKGVSYTGPEHYTTDGTPCIAWNDAWRYKDTGGDYCRNPMGSGSRPWCYTDSQGGYGYCDQIPQCGCNGFNPSKCGCSNGNKSDYRGNISVTRSGKPCQYWAAQTPHSHPYIPDSREYRGSDLAENFCRNPNNESDGPWCYVDDPTVRWDRCDVPTCGGVLSE